jgi:hypothetical protein
MMVPMSMHTDTRSTVPGPHAPTGPHALRPDGVVELQRYLTRS